MNKKVDLKDALATPGQIFSSPQDVVLNNEFSEQEKEKILTNWKDQYIQLQRAANEGMESKNPDNTLAQISNALKSIEQQTD